MAGKVLNEDGVEAKDKPGRGMGGFERLAIRFTGGYAHGTLAGLGESSRAARAAASDEQDQAWELIFALPAQLASQKDWRKGSELDEKRRAGALWEKLATSELVAMRKATEQAVASGWEPAGKMSSQLEAAAAQVAAGYDLSQDAVKVFALGWEKSGSLESYPKSHTRRACGLGDYGSTAPERLAALALTARCARRVCDMALGRHPRFQSDASGNGEYTQKLGLAAARGVWSTGDGAEGLGGASYGEAAAGLAHEPSLGLMSAAWGALSIEALCHGAAGGAGEIVEMFAEHWMANNVIGTRTEGLNKWRFPSRDMGGYGLAESRAGAADRSLEALSGVEQVAIAAGVPAWSLGVGVVPAERWMGEAVKSRVESAPKGYWGAGDAAEAERQAWGRLCAKERRSIDEASLSASYSDDPGCRSSESADCARQSVMVDAQEALVDWAMRKELATESPWALTPGCVMRIAADLSRLDGEKTDMFNRFGVPGFKEVLSRAGVDFGHGAQAADLVGRFMALSEAAEISKVFPLGARPSSSMRM